MSPRPPTILLLLRRAGLALLGCCLVIATAPGPGRAEGIADRTDDELKASAGDPSGPEAERLAAMRELAFRVAPGSRKLLRGLLEDRSPVVAVAALARLAQLDPPAALGAARAFAEDDARPAAFRREAIRLLGVVLHPDAAGVLAGWVPAVRAGRLDPQMAAPVLEALGRRREPEAKAALADVRAKAVPGDPFERALRDAAPPPLDPALAAGRAEIEAVIVELASLNAGGPDLPDHPGRPLYLSLCLQCHKEDGTGVEGLYPPLKESEWLAMPNEVLVRILLHGMEGPVKVAGSEYENAMPPHGGSLEDAQIADVIEFVRLAFGQPGSPAVTAESVASVRAADAGRTVPWTADELLATAGQAPAAADRPAPATPTASGAPIPRAGITPAPPHCAFPTSSWLALGVVLVFAAALARMSGPMR